MTGLRLGFANTEDVTIGAGRCRDSTNTTDMINSGTLTLLLDGGGDGSTGINKLDTGSEANDTWYAVHLIGGNGQAAQGLLSTNATSPTLPTGFTHFRRVGWVRNNGSGNLLSFIQTGEGRERVIDYNEAKNTVLILLSGGTATTWTDIVGTTLIPSTSEAAHFHLMTNAWASGWTQIRGNALAGATNAQVLINAQNKSDSDTTWLRCQAQKLQYIQSHATNTLYCYLLAYRDSL